MKTKTLLYGILLMLFTYNVNAQVEGTLTGFATGEVIKQLGDQAKGIIQQAEQSGDFILKRSSQEVLYMLDAFEAANENLLNKSFDKIGKERRAVLNKMIEVTNSLQSEVDLTLNRAEQILDQLNILVRDVTFKKYPVIFRYRGGIVVPGNTQKIRITIDGANLNRLSKPRLTFRGEEYIANQLGESIFFELPKSLFSANTDTFKSEIGKLSIEHKYGGFWGMFEKIKITKYDLNIITLPSQLGKAKLSYKREVIEKKEKVYSGEVSHNSSRRSWDCRSFAFSPSTSNRRINPDRSWVRKHHGNSNGQLRDVSIRDVGISFRICARRRIWDRGNGFRHAKYYYVEEWTETKFEDMNVSNSFDWIEDIVLKTEGNSKDFLVEIELFTGKKVALTSSGIASKYLSVIFDNDQNLVILKPIIPSDILRL